MTMRRDVDGHVRAKVAGNQGWPVRSGRARGRAGARGGAARARLENSGRLLVRVLDLVKCNTKLQVVDRVNVVLLELRCITFRILTRPWKCNTSCDRDMYYV